MFDLKLGIGHSEVPGPNTTNIGVWRVKVFRLGIVA
jgi:hypothetical protein